MGKKDPRVDAYIAKSAEFAKPILHHLREVVHDAVPDVEETIKWGMPTFMYKGMLLGIAAFKQHAALHFRHGRRVIERAESRAGEAMGQFGRLTELSELPSRNVLVGYMKRAAALNESGVKTVRRAARKAMPAVARVPAELAAALKKSRKALATFKALAPSRRREYVEWIVEAKRPETRVRRVGITVEWLEEGKGLNWKYEKR